MGGSLPRCFTSPSKSIERRGLAALAHEAAELRAAYRDLPAQLAALEGFDGLFLRWIERWRPIMVRMDQRPWDPRDERIAGDVAELDDMRLDLYSRQSTALPSYRDPLNKMLYTSLREPGPGLYDLFGDLAAHPDDTRPVQAVSLARFDARVAEAKAEIARQRLELEARMRLDGARLHEMEDALPRLLLSSLRSLLWKTTWRRVVTTISALLVASLAPPVRAALGAVWNLVRAWL